MLTDEQTADIEYDNLLRVVDGEAAILVRIDTEGVWIPRSQIVDHDEDGKVITVQECWATQEGLT